MVNHIKNILLFTLLTSHPLAMAQENPLTVPLSEQDIKQLDCSAALDRLEISLQIQQQLSSSFLGVNDTLETVYRTYGKELSQSPDTKKTKEIANIFQTNASALAAAKSQNQDLVNAMNQESMALVQRIKICIQTPGKSPQGQ